MRCYVFSLSAAIALFDSHPDAVQLVKKAEAGDVTVVIPTTVIAEMPATAQAWEAVILTEGVFTVPLTEQVAAHLEDQPWPLVDRHTAYEAKDLAAVVVVADDSWPAKDVPTLRI